MVGLGVVSLFQVFCCFLFYKRKESWLYELLGNLIVMVFIKVYLKVRKYMLREVVWNQLNHLLSWEYWVIYAIVIAVGDWLWYGILNTSLLEAVLSTFRIKRRARFSGMLLLEFLLVLLESLFFEVDVEWVHYLFSHIGDIFSRLQYVLLKQFV